MVRDRIDEMPAGPKMNELIATEIMGWQPSKIHLGFWATVLEDGCEYNHHPIDEWSPSTSFADAMEVVDKMRRLDFWWAASYKEQLLGDTWSAAYSVVFRCARAGMRGTFSAAALELPLAICRTALKASEYQ